MRPIRQMTSIDIDCISVLYTIDRMCLVGRSTRASESRAPSGGARPRRGKIPDRQDIYIR